VTRVAIYARVSTEDQSVDQQLERLRALAPNAIEYVDRGVSGRLDSRPEFDRLKGEIRAGRVSAAYVVKLDRLGRSAGSVLEFFKVAETHGTRVVVVDQQIDTSTPVGRLVRTILAAMAELEADLIAERTRDAMAAFKSGARIPKSPVGRPRVVTPEKVERARRLRLADPKLTWAELAQRVGLKSETVRRDLRGAARNPPAKPAYPAALDGEEEDR
jgi:DNA invertase Pin-like site-specific DNA recombinase